MVKSRYLLAVLPLTWPNMPPIGLGYLQAFLAQNGISAGLADLNHAFYALSNKELQRQWMVSCNTALEENILSLIKKDHPAVFHASLEKMLDYEVVGLESGSDATLRRMNKGFTAEDASWFFKSLHHAGLFFGVSMIVGYPGEGEPDFQESLDFVLRHRDVIPQIAQINPFTYYDGTDADKSGDYKAHPEVLRRMEVFVQEIKKHKFRCTNAYIGNLIEKQDYRKPCPQSHLNRFGRVCNQPLYRV